MRIRHAVCLTCFRKQITVFHRNGLVCRRLPQEARRRIRRHMFFQRHIRQLFFRRVFSEQRFKRASMRLFSGSDHRITQDRGIRSVENSGILRIFVFHIFIVYTDTSAQMPSRRKTTDRQFIFFHMKCLGIRPDIADRPG